MIQLVKHVVKRALPAGHWERFRARWWRYLRPLTVDYCPKMLPWFTSARSGSPAARLHRLATSFHWENRWSPVTALALGVTVGTVKSQTSKGMAELQRLLGTDEAPLRMRTPVRTTGGAGGTNR